MLHLFSYSFMQHALLAGLLASIVCGVIGSLVVVNRLVFMAGGIAHTAYGGIGLAFYLGLPVMLTTIGFTLLAALLLAYLTIYSRGHVDTLIGVLWAAGMGLGILLINLTPGFNVDLMSYLFGSILTVSTNDLWIMLALNILVLTLVGYHYHSFVSMTFDAEYARTRGIPVNQLYFLLLSLIAIAVVMLIQIVGLILIIALLTIPAFVAQRYSRTLGTMIIHSILWSMLFTILGLLASYYLDVASGATIIMVATLGFLLVLTVEKIYHYLGVWQRGNVLK